MKYTKRQRHSIYKKMLGRMRYFDNVSTGKTCCGLCAMYSGVTGEFCDNMVYHLPEIAEYEPIYTLDNGYWFTRSFTRKGHLKRYAILRACIKKTAPKPRK